MCQQLSHRMVCYDTDRAVCPDCGCRNRMPEPEPWDVAICKGCGRMFIVSDDGLVKFTTYQLGCCSHCGEIVNFDLFGAASGFHQGADRKPCPGVGKAVVQQTARSEKPPIRAGSRPKR